MSDHIDMVYWHRATDGSYALARCRGVRGGSVPGHPFEYLLVQPDGSALWWPEDRVFWKSLRSIVGGSMWADGVVAKAYEANLIYDGDHDDTVQGREWVMQRLVRRACEAKEAVA